jgi:hypothetical protein
VGTKVWFVHVAEGILSSAGGVTSTHTSMTNDFEIPNSLTHLCIICVMTNFCEVEYDMRSVGRDALR